MPKVGITKTPKTFTLSISTLAWLDEYCIKKNQKMSAVVNELINELRKQTEAPKYNLYWCTSCSDNTVRTIVNDEPVCADCLTVDDALSRARKQFNLKQLPTYEYVGVPVGNTPTRTTYGSKT